MIKNKTLYWVIILEIIFILSIFKLEISIPRLLFLSIIQLSILVIFFLIYLKKFIVINITTILILILNFVTTPLLYERAIFISLKPNINTKIQIIGEVMPGFSNISEVTTDDFGFRVSQEIDYQTKNKYRIFAIGGSTTEQIFLSDNETWSYLLEKKLNYNTDIEFEIINTGVSGAFSANHYASLKKLNKLNPDLFIFLVGINDWNKHIKSNFNNRNIFRIDKSLIWLSFSKIKGLLKNENKNSKVEFFVENGEYYSNQNDSLNRSIIEEFYPEEVGKSYSKWMNKIFNLCNSIKANCLFISQPSAYQLNISKQLKKRLWMTPPNEEYTLTLNNLKYIAEKYNLWLEKNTIKNDLIYCDLAKYFSADIKYFYDDCHFNEGGAKFFSEKLYDCIISEINFSKM